MKIRRTLMPAVLTLALAASLIAQPALAAGAARTINDPLHSGFGVSCQAGDCVLQLDLGEIEFDMPVLTSAPVKFDVPQDKVPFLPGGAGIEISDKIELRLPFGKIQIDEGDFVVRVDEVGKLVSFHGASASIVPTFSFANNMRIVHPNSGACRLKLSTAPTRSPWRKAATNRPSVTAPSSMTISSSG